ncbi:MAG: hypothetical protein HPY58_02885 [Firmicutes bacterium]|nr:hypothetical protein [Bacillota bacterium]
MPENFFDLLEKWERGLQGFLIICFLGLVTLQLMFTREPFRFYLSFAERLEGVAWPDKGLPALVQGEERLGKVQITAVGYFSLPRAAVLVNGRPVASFKERKVWVKVREGDEIQIDASAYVSPLAFRVSKVSPEVSWPRVNCLIETNGTRVSMGKVKLK